MALKVYDLTEPGYFLLVDGASFRIVGKNYVSDIFTADTAKKLIEFLNSPEIDLIIDRLNKGEKLSELERTVTYSVEGPDYSDTNFMALTVTVNGAKKSSWTGMILRDEGCLELPTGVINDLYVFLTSSGVKPDGKGYYTIRTVEELPKTDIRTDIAFLLTKADGNKPAGTMWRWNGTKWLALSEGQEDDPDVEPEPVERDPMDSTDYPDFDVKDDEPQSMGGSDVNVTEVVNGNITLAANAVATELATCINCTMGDGSFAMTVK